MEEDLKRRCADILSEVDELISKLEGFRNEQWVLDFCDKLNQYSIQY